MKRTILFTTALATAAGLFAMGAAQASERSGKSEGRDGYQARTQYLSGEGNEYRERNRFTERNEYRDRNEYRERTEDRDRSGGRDNGSDDSSDD